MDGQAVAKRGDLRLHAYHWLRSRIMSAEIAPGSRITERDVAEQLGTSTVPVREALLLLAGHHLVSAHNGKGYEVAALSVPAADSTLRLQAHLDGEAADAAARARRPDTQEHLALILASVGPAAGHTWNDEPGCNSHFDFHVHIAAHAGHDALAKAVNDCMIETERIRRHLLRQGAHVEHDLAEHQAILDAVVNGRGARKVARDHALAHRRQLLRALQEVVSA